MPDLGTQIGVARQAGYSDADITAFLSKDPSLGPKVAQAKSAGYSDAEIADHLASSAPKPSENVFQKAWRIGTQEAGAASDAFKADVQAANAKHGQDLIADAKPILDTVRAAAAPIKGVMDATFGDQPAHLPSSIAGVQVPQALQNINSKGLTGGDIATVGLGGAGELAKGAQLARAADQMGVSARTAEQTLAASKAPASITRTAVTPAPPTNDLAAKVQAFDDAGVRPSLAAMGQGNARVAKAIAENPLAGGRARTALQASLDDTGQAMDKAAQSYGTPAARGAAGEAVQQGIQSFNDRFSTRAEALYDKAFGNIDAAMAGKTDAPRTATVFDDSGAHSIPVGGSQITTPATSAAIGQMGQTQSKALGAVIKDPTVSKIGAALTDANQAQDMSFQDLRSLRTKVRLAQDNDQLRQDIGAANLQRIEGALTQDINTNAATLAGPQAARQLQQADQFYRLGSQRIQGALQKFVGRSGDASGESAYDLVQRMASDKGGADTGRLTALKNSLKPSEWGDVAASTINRMAQGKDGAFSVNTFVTNMDNLSPQGKALLFGQGEQRAALDNLVKVARMQKGVEQAANHSNTASAAQSLATVAGLANPHTTVPTMAGLGGMAATGEMLTNPKAVRWIANLGKAEQTSPAAVSSALGRLRADAARNASLLPVYAEATRAFGTPALPAAAMPASPAQSTPGPNN